MPPKTPAFWAIVDANRAPEDAELADALDALGVNDEGVDLGRSDAVTLAQLVAKAERETHEWLLDRKNRRATLTDSSSAATSQYATQALRMGSSR